MSAHAVYELRFPNGKRYIGVARNPEARWRSHKLNAARNKPWPLSQAIRKVGAEKVSRRTLLIGSRSYVLMMERAIIKAFATIAPCGYNVMPGGDESPATHQSAREKIRASAVRRWQDPAYRAAMVERGKAQKPTAEQRAKNSEAKLRNWADPHYRERLVKSHVGKSPSAATRLKMAQAQIGHANRNTNPAPRDSVTGRWTYVVDKGNT